MAKRRLKPEYQDVPGFKEWLDETVHPLTGIPRSGTPRKEVQLFHIITEDVPEPPATVTAVLTTRCGCQKELQLPYPAPREICIPIISGNSSGDQPGPDHGYADRRTSRRFVMDPRYYSLEDVHRRAYTEQM